MHFFYDTFLLFPVQNSDLSLLCARGGGSYHLLQQCVLGRIHMYA